MNTTVSLADALQGLGLHGNEADVDEFASYDVAELNLACAKDLPGSDELNVEKCLTTLDEWAAHVQREIERHYYRFLQSPEKFNNSQGWFCVLMMITVLQQDFGVRYNPERIHDPDFTNSRDLFLHGLITGAGGTCASMPVLYAAIGRRLRHPIKLVHARSHVFCRWDDPKGRHPFGPDRFNIEGAGIGTSSFPDDYYLTWPEPIRAEDIPCGIYLRSLEAKEELASFLATRGHCLLDNRRFSDARTAYGAACLLAPNDPHYRAFLEDAERKHEREFEHLYLLMYYGPHQKLPYGVFNKSGLHKLMCDMVCANAELTKFGLGLNSRPQPSVPALNDLNHARPASAKPPLPFEQENALIAFGDVISKLPFAELERITQTLSADRDLHLPNSESSRRFGCASREHQRRSQEATTHLQTAKLLAQPDSPKRLPKYADKHVEELAKTKAHF